MSSDAPSALPATEIHACRLSLFVACYNEEAAIIQTLDTVVAACDEVKIVYEIIIIDDCSTDNSVKLVRQYMDEHRDLPIKLYVNEVNMGLGANYAEGAFRGSGQYYRLICGDNVESKERLVTIFKRIGEADMVIPYPEKTIGRSAGRRLISTSFTSLVNLLGGFNVKYYNGLAIHLRYNVMRWHSNAHGFGFQADLVTRLLDMNATYVEVPVTSEDRAGGESKALTLRNLCSVAHSLLEIFIRRMGKVIYPNSRRKPMSKMTVYTADNAREGEVTLSVAEVGEGGHISGGR